MNRTNDHGYCKLFAKHIFDASGTLDTCAHVLADPDSDENAIVNAMRSTHAVLKRLSAIRKSHADILSTMLDCDRDAFDSNTR